MKTNMFMLLLSHIVKSPVYSQQGKFKPWLNLQLSTFELLCVEHVHRLTSVVASRLKFGIRWTNYMSARLHAVHTLLLYLLTHCLIETIAAT